MSALLSNASPTLTEMELACASILRDSDKQHPSSSSLQGKSCVALPENAMANVLDMLSTDVKQACRLQAVARSWRSYMWRSCWFKDLFNRGVEELLEAAARSPDVGGNVPVALWVFLQQWLRFQQEKQEGQHSCGTMHAYVGMRGVCSTRDRALSAARKAIVLKRHRHWTSELMIKIGNASLFLLAPLGGFCLAISADGLLDLPVFVGASLGLLGCVINFLIVGARAYTELKILRFKRRCRVCIGPQKTAEWPHFLRTDQHFVTILDCMHWLSVCSTASVCLILLMLMPGSRELLITIVCLSWLPVLFAAASWSTWLWCKVDTVIELAGRTFRYHFSVAWLLTGMEIAQHVDAAYSASIFFLAILLPCAGAIMEVACSLRHNVVWSRASRMPILEYELEHWGQGFTWFGVLVPALAALGVALARAHGYAAARDFPITALMTPVQIPCLVFLLWIVACRCQALWQWACNARERQLRAAGQNGTLYGIGVEIEV